MRGDNDGGEYARWTLGIVLFLFLFSIPWACFNACYPQPEEAPTVKVVKKCQGI